MLSLALTLIDMDQLISLGGKQELMTLGRHFEDVEADLQLDWEKNKTNPKLSWDQIKTIARDAWDEIEKKKT
jgi:hypothetical protein